MKIIDFGKLKKKLKSAELDFSTASSLYKEDGYWRNYLLDKCNFTDEDFQACEIGETIGFIDGDIKKLSMVLSLSSGGFPEWLVMTGGWRNITKDDIKEIQIPKDWVIPSVENIKEIELSCLDLKKYLYESGCYFIWLSDTGKTKDINDSILPFLEYPAASLSLSSTISDHDRKSHKYSVMYKTGMVGESFYHTISGRVRCDVKLFRKLGKI